MECFFGPFLIISGCSFLIMSLLYNKIFEPGEGRLCISDDCGKLILKNNLRLATKTPYRAVQNDDAQEITFAGCYQTKLWSLLRHGTRTSKRKHRTEVSQLNFIRDVAVRELLNTDDKEPPPSFVEEIMKWKSHEELNDGLQTLTNEGQQEMFFLGRRYFTRFRSLFNESRVNRTYVMRFTDTQRTNSSAYYFASGIFGGTDKNVYNMERVPDNKIIRFYKDCHKWRKEVKKNFSANFEQISFANSAIMKTLINRLSSKLGYKQPLAFGKGTVAMPQDGGVLNGCSFSGRVSVLNFRIAVSHSKVLYLH